jgi:hypothetical protein
LVLAEQFGLAVLTQYFLQSLQLVVAEVAIIKMLLHQVEVQAAEVEVVTIIHHQEPVELPTKVMQVEAVPLHRHLLLA